MSSKQTQSGPTDGPSNGAITPTGAAAASRGIAGSWLMGSALITALVMIVLLLGMIAGEGVSTFWPRPIERVELTSGGEFLGKRVRTETGPDGQRVLYRVGNRDLGQTPFRWVLESDIAQVSTPANAVLLERESWGVWIGELEAVVRADENGEYQPIAGDPFEVLADVHPESRRAVARADAIREHDIGRLNREIERNRLRLSQARLDASREPVRVLPSGLWLVGLIGAPLCLIGAGVLGWTASNRRGRVIAAGALVVLGVLGGLVGWTERPAGDVASRLERLETSVPDRERELYAQIQQYERQIGDIEREQAAIAVHVRDLASGRLAPAGQSELDRPLPVASVVRMVPANQLGTLGRAGVYLSRWGEFLTGDPRAANTEGGIFPVIFGTVLLTLLLTVSVLPLGVVAALYMREYAKQGPLISVLRIAINNLAGVPSIVYGVFGLGFFCYTVGKYVDGGPAVTIEPAGGFGTWWGLAGMAGALALGGLTFGVLAKPVPGQHATALSRWMRIGSVIAWLGCGAVAAVLITTTPYFNGFFEARAADGSPTFGGRGLLWASLTLALLTLPVVIVSTEEAIAAVPASMREGSYGCGASKWQTIRNIVLPGAMPGIMTGAILAMARGAGEVAPLMIVGAVKLAPELPFETRFPFVFADRSFMHLGFHIFDLGFQSPDSEAARGMVWTTTLVLITLVVLLNVTAIVLRSRLRARGSGGQF